MRGRAITAEQINQVEQHLLTPNRMTYIRISMVVGVSVSVIHKVAAQLVEQGKLDKPKPGPRQPKKFDVISDDFKAWLDQLNIEAAKREYIKPFRFWQTIGSEYWKKYYLKNMSPAKALDKDEAKVG